MANITALAQDNFDSISEGCFLVMPGKKRHNNSQKQPTRTKKTKATTKKVIKITHRSEEDSHTILNDGFRQLFNESESTEAMLYRKNSFKNSWEKVNKLITDVLLDMNHTAVQDICNFVEKANDTQEGMVQLPFHEIPTGLVFAGINTPDHDTQFAHIASKLREEEDGDRKKKFVSLLHSKDCSNIKNMIKTMIEKFLENTPHALRTGGGGDTYMEEKEEEEENDDEGDVDDEDIIRMTERAPTSYRLGGHIGKPSKCLPYDMQLLEGWYKYHASKYTTDPSLVIILQDFESFDPTVLQDFFTICSEYRSRLPIVCIIGIATSTEIFHQALSKSTIGLLRIEKFKLEQSQVWIDKVMDRIFVEPTNTLKFGARPFKFLLEHFYLYDFSISKVTASLKYALMHHFYGNALSIFLPLLSLSKTEMSETLKEWMNGDMLSEDHITNIRMLASFRAYIESLALTDPKKALHLLQDNEYLIIDTIPVLLQDIKLQQQKFKMGFKLVLLLQSHFTKFQFTHKAKRLLLLEALDTKDGNLAEKSSVITSLVRLVRKIDAEHVSRLLKDFRDLIEQSDYKNVNQDFIGKLSEWDTRYEVLMTADEADTDKMNKKAKRLEGIVLADEEMGSRHTETAKKVQTQSLDFLKIRGTELSKIAMDISEWCDQILKQCFKPFNELPLYELVYYTNSKLHEKSFASQPRASVQTALTQSQHYVGCRCCSTEKSDQIISSEHDTCILYKLYLECGRLINLYDWFVAFGYVIEKEKRPSDQDLEENEVQARFIRSVAELQFLGFIKPTQRKTDHVIRLTWSNI